MSSEDFDSVKTPDAEDEGRGILVHGSANPGMDQELIESVKTDIRENYEFGLFSILPGLTSDYPTLQRYAKKIGIDANAAERFAFRLIKSGLWKVKGNQVESNFELLDLGDISVKEYLSMTIAIISRLSETDSSYAYDTLSVVTNRTLIRSFITKVNSALKDLHNESNALKPSEKEAVFSWSHTGVIEVEKKKPTPKPPRQDN